MDPEGFQCKRCGTCCTQAWFPEVGEADVRLWEKKGRTDILAWVRRRAIGDGGYAYEVWVDPSTGQEVDRCPWLFRLPQANTYVCQIQEMKPSICRHFPASRRQAEEIGCRGFEQ